MLKKSLVLAAALAATISTYGQGSIVFNVQTTGQRITDHAGANLGLAAYSAQLYAAASETGALEPIGKAYPFRGGVNTGYINVPAAEQAVTVPTATPGGATWLQIRAWDAAHATYDAAVAANGAFGASAIWTQDTGAIGAIPPEPPPGITGYQGFALAVPEPSMLALLGVGAAALLFRRRK